MSIKYIVSIFITSIAIRCLSQNKTEEIEALIESKNYTKAYFAANKLLELGT